MRALYLFCLTIVGTCPTQTQPPVDQERRPLLRYATYQQEEAIVMPFVERNPVHQEADIAALQRSIDSVLKDVQEETLTRLIERIHRLGNTERSQLLPYLMQQPRAQYRNTVALLASGFGFTGVSCFLFAKAIQAGASGELNTFLGYFFGIPLTFVTGGVLGLQGLAALRASRSKNNALDLLHKALQQEEV